MFNTSDWTRILIGLGLSTKDKPKLLQAMIAIEVDSPELIPEIQNKLTELEEINGLIKTEQSSPNSALIRADVLEWSEGDRLSGMMTRRKELKESIFNLLDLASYGLVLSYASQPGSSSYDIKSSF